MPCGPPPSPVPEPEVIKKLSLCLSPRSLHSSEFALFAVTFIHSLLRSTVALPSSPVPLDRSLGYADGAAKRTNSAFCVLLLILQMREKARTKHKTQMT